MLSRRLVFAIALGALFAATPALAQGKGKGKGKGAPDGQRPAAAQQDQGGPGGGGPGMRQHRGRGQGRGFRDEVMESLYPVELVREHAGEIGLTDEQIEKLRKLVSDVRNEIDQLQWDLEREHRKLVELVKKGASKEEIYAQLEVTFGYENKIKKKHLGLLVVVRDVLNAKQRAQLDQIKAEREQEQERWRDARPDRGPGMGPGGPGGPGMGPGGPGGGPGMPPPPPGSPTGF